MECMANTRGELRRYCPIAGGTEKSAPGISISRANTARNAAGGARPDDECQSRDLPPAANEGPERDCEPIWSFFRKKVSAVPKLT